MRLNQIRFSSNDSRHFWDVFLYKHKRCLEATIAPFRANNFRYFTDQATTPTEEVSTTIKTTEETTTTTEEATTTTEEATGSKEATSCTEEVTSTSVNELNRDRLSHEKVEPVGSSDAS